MNFLIAIALGWSATNRARVGMALAGILFIPGTATLWTAWEKFLVPMSRRKSGAQRVRDTGRQMRELISH